MQPVVKCQWCKMIIINDNNDNISTSPAVDQQPEASYCISRLTVVSREAKKKQHACASSGPRDHYSELFTRMAALKF